MTSKKKDLDGVASIEDVERILDQLLLQEAEVDAKLELLLDPNNQPDLTALTTLQSTGAIEEEIIQLNERIGPTAETASGLSERVKKLDIEQARLKESLKYVEDVQELKVSTQYSYKFNCRTVYWVSMMRWKNKIGMRLPHSSIKHLFLTHR